jgi:AcrR family transcriptional regulator
MDTRTALLQEAQRAFATHGYGATSLEDIAAKLGLTKATIYHHFGSKRALLTTLLDESLAAAQQALQMPAPLETRLQAYADIYRDHLEPLTAVTTAQSTRRGRDLEAIQIAQEYMQRSVALLGGALREEVGPERAMLLASIFSTLIHGAHMMAQHHPGLHLDTLVAESVRVFVYGIREEQRG